MKWTQELARLLAALFAGAACIVARTGLSVYVLAIVLASFVFFSGCYRPVPWRPLRSLSFLIFLILLSYWWSDDVGRGCAAAGKVLDLFLVSLVLMRGLKAAGIYRAFHALGPIFRVPLRSLGEVALLPALLSRLNREWRAIGFALASKATTGRRWTLWLYRLRILFWRSQVWPSSLRIAYNIRVGDTGAVASGASRSQVGWMDLSLLSMGALCVALVWLLDSHCV